ncbi:MAG: hypothetical protein KTR35_00440 [Gammaproteobacteria bacterium]|nr:hypothetical protein [Gammaproteobacteria bacterium]
MHAIGRFVSLHPQVHVSTDFTDHDVDPVKDGYDLSIRSGQLDKLGAMVRGLGLFERAIFVGKGYLADRPKVKHPKALMEWDWINYRHSKRVYQLTSKAGKTTKLTIRDQSRLQVDNFDALNTFACLDLGVVVMPIEFAQRGLQEKKLVRLFDNWHFPKGKYFAVWPDKSYRESLVAVFVDYLTNQLNSDVQ